jgi:hypothetical protein
MYNLFRTEDQQGPENRTEGPEVIWMYRIFFAIFLLLAELFLVQGLPLFEQALNNNIGNVNGQAVGPHLATDPWQTQEEK